MNCRIKNMAKRLRTVFIYISKSYQLFFYLNIAKLFTRQKFAPVLTAVVLYLHKTAVSTSE